MQYRAQFAKSLGSAAKLYHSEWFDTQAEAMAFVREFDGRLFFRAILDSNGEVV